MQEQYGRTLTQLLVISSDVIEFGKRHRYVTFQVGTPKDAHGHEMILMSSDDSPRRDCEPEVMRVERTDRRDLTLVQLIEF